LVTHPDPDIRWFAADYIGAVATTNELSLLLSLLTDAQRSVRIKALRALAELGDKGALEGIDSFLVDKETKLSKEDQWKDPSVREARKTIEAIKARLAMEIKESPEPK
jgi:HEAT repeat protein